MIADDGRVMCDWETCSRLKGPSDRFWLQYEQAGQLVTRAWDSEIARFPSVMHICSIKCAELSLRSWMEFQIERETRLRPQLVRMR